MAAPASIADYFRMYGSALGDHVLSRFPALHGPADPVSPALSQLKRRPFPAQAMAIMGIVKSRVLYPARIDDRYARLKGCDESFLASLPNFIPY